MDTFLFAIPALFYFVMNSVTFYCLALISASTYAVLSNLKIISTGVMFFFILKRPLSKMQWTALLIMTVGASVSQLPKSSTDATFDINPNGLIMVLVQVTLSGASATFLDWLVKRDLDSINLQNMKLYVFGCMLCICSSITSATSANIFYGHNWCSMLIVLTLAFQGLITSWVMKYTDSIVKTLAAAVSMFVTSFVSYFLFAEAFSPQFFLGAINCVIALFMYATQGIPPSAARTT